VGDREGEDLVDLPVVSGGLSAKGRSWDSKPPGASVVNIEGPADTVRLPAGQSAMNIDIAPSSHPPDRISEPVFGLVRHWGLAEPHPDDHRPPVPGAAEGWSLVLAFISWAKSQGRGAHQALEGLRRTSDDLGEPFSIIGSPTTISPA
jgi:hypothetical protein